MNTDTLPNDVTPEANSEASPIEAPLFPAPLMKRLMALMYDAFILVALSMLYSALATIAMVGILGQQNEGDYRPMQEGLWFQLGWVLAIVGFYWFFWARAGQTVGMRAWSLKVVTIDGKPPSHKQILIRICVAPFALGIAGLGYLWCLFNKDKAAWQDIASQTQVVMTPKLEKKKK